MDDENLPPSRHREILHQRKIAKPLMEKRRRERINNCLDQLKSLLTEVTKKADKDEEEENSYRSKLEKADILEMTVNYLKSVKRQKMTMGACPSSADPAASSIHSGYEAGFRECAQQVSKYLEKADGLSPATRSTIVQHLTRRLHHQQQQQNPGTRDIHQRHNNSGTTTSPSSPPPPQLVTSPSSAQGLQGLVVQAPSSSFVGESANSASVVSHPVQLLPVKLASGETVFALVNANDPLLLFRHQMANEKPINALRRHTIEDKASGMDGENNGIVMYEAISPPETVVSPLQLSQKNNHTDHLRPVSSASNPSAHLHGKLQTTKHQPPPPPSIPPSLPPSIPPSLPLAKGHRSANNWSLVFNNTAPELKTENSKFPTWLLSECSSSGDGLLPVALPIGLPQVVTDSCQMSDDQSHVWRPW